MQFILDFTSQLDEFTKNHENFAMFCTLFFRI